MGNALRDVACTLAEAQVDPGGSYILEQPASSIMLYSPPLEKLKTSTSATTATLAVCFDGVPWQKRTSLVSDREEFSCMNAECVGCAKHQLLAGKAPCGRNWTQVACPYWLQFSRAVAVNLVKSFVRRLLHAKGSLTLEVFSQQMPGQASCSF